MIETRRRAALTSDLRHAIEAAKRKAEEEADDPHHLGCTLRALEALDRNDPRLDVHAMCATALFSAVEGYAPQLLGLGRTDCR